MTPKYQVTYEPTPNPQSMMFKIDRPISESTHDFQDAAAAEKSPLASKLFGFPWTSSVCIGMDFVTITKQDWVTWEALAQPLTGLIQEHLESGQPIVFRDNGTVEAVDPSTIDNSEEAQTIRALIDNEIRPAVAMDGGDIIFHKYEKGIVYIYMRGSCSGCPSSTQTLKMGIEVRIKEVLPQVIEVVSL